MPPIDQAKLDSLFSLVSRPGQYLGDEVNRIKKDFDSAKVRVALVFPDKYEIGMSHLGLKILYDILNKIPTVVCERAFAPDVDMEKELRHRDIPLFSLESHRPLADFDIVGFSLTYELTYTNMLNILDLADIPIWQKDRSDTDPLIIAGGGCTMNAEPVADFLDAAVIGDGEEVVREIVEVVKNLKKKSGARSQESEEKKTDILNTYALKHLNTQTHRHNILNKLSQIEGVYIPSFFQPEYNEDGTIRRMVPLKENYTQVKKRIVSNLDQAPFPTSPIVSTVQLIHDRIGIEIQRGCARACRFCQAGSIERPVRQRSPERILEIAEASLRNTGIDNLSLLSLSAADYDCLIPLLKELNKSFSHKKIAISVPATRTEKLTPELAEQIKQVRKTGFTIAPEAATEKMRRIINKGNKVDDLYKAIHTAFEKGWNLVKLYYMVGLPLETDDDVSAIASEAYECIKIGLQYTGRAEINLSLSSFVPKPHTPFQWEPQMTLDETQRRYDLVRNNLKNRRIHCKHHNPKMSYIEGLLARGDRRTAKLIDAAHKEGCKFDEWEEHFNFVKWKKVIEDWEMDPSFYLHRKRKKDEVFPWDHLFSQINKDYLWNEWKKAEQDQVEFTDDCSVANCSNCGVCDFKEVKNRTYTPNKQEIVVKKGNRETYGWNQAQPVIPAEAGIQFSYMDPGFRRDDGGVVKLRVHFSKIGPARFIGHLELMGILRRALKRLEVPVCYSEGFHPQMRLSMGHPLPHGVESVCEYFDLELSTGIEKDLFINSLNNIIPEGLQIHSAEFIDRKESSLYCSLKDVTYRASFVHEAELWTTEHKESVQRFLNLKEFQWQKENKKKTFNLKDEVEVTLAYFPETLIFKTRVNADGSVGLRDVLRALMGLTEEELSRIRLQKVGINNSLNP